MTDIDWAALAAPFPDSEIKERPGGGGKMFKYVDARVVAQRLDDVLTPALWNFTCAVIPGSDIVKGRLEIDGIVREDHGYQNDTGDKEPIKSATSDALKRCAVMFGIGRHLYEDNQPGSFQTRQNGHSAPPRPQVAPTPIRSQTDIPEDIDDLDWDKLSPAPAPNRAEGTMWSKELFTRAEAANIDKRAISDTAKKMFGKDHWKVTDLDDSQRFALAVELGVA